MISCTLRLHCALGRQQQVLDHLLRDRRPALRRAPAQHVGDERARHAPVVDAAVLEVVGVLGGDHRLDEQLRDRANRERRSASPSRARRSGRCCDRGCASPAWAGTRPAGSDSAAWDRCRSRRTGRRHRRRRRTRRPCPAWIARMQVRAATRGRSPRPLPRRSGRAHHPLRARRRRLAATRADRDRRAMDQQPSRAVYPRIPGVQETSGRRTR